MKKYNLALLSLALLTLPSLALAEDLPPGLNGEAAVTTSSDTTLDDTSATTSTETAVTTSVQTGGFKDFTDVSVDNPYYNSIVLLRYQGVLNGYDDNTFKPNQALNRVEALKLILEIANVNMSGGVAEAKFKDTQSNTWYSGYLNRATFLEIVAGYPDGTFKPEQSVNLVEFLKMLTLAQKVDLSGAVLAQIPYADVLPGQWYSKYINYAKINNLLRVDEDNKVMPDQPLTRGRAADIIFKFRNAIGSSTQTGDDTTPAESKLGLMGNFAIYVNSVNKFAVQYPKVWFYSSLIANADGVIRTYGFGPDDLETNPPQVLIEVLPANADFQTNMELEGYSYHREEVEGFARLTTRLDGSNNLYRLSGQVGHEDTMLKMMSSMTTNVEGLQSYNPAEKTEEQPNP